MFSKKSMKQLKKLPANVRAAALAADDSEAFGNMLQSSGNTLVSIRLPGHYRMVKTRAEGEVVWIGTHENYNKLVARGGRL